MRSIVYRRSCWTSRALSKGPVPRGEADPDSLRASAGTADYDGTPIPLRPCARRRPRGGVRRSRTRIDWRGSVSGGRFRAAEEGCGGRRGCPNGALDPRQALRAGKLAERALLASDPRAAGPPRHISGKRPRTGFTGLPPAPPASSSRLARASTCPHGRPDAGWLLDRCAYGPRDAPVDELRAMR